jgi:hypothetical protein
MIYTRYYGVKILKYRNQAVGLGIRWRYVVMPQNLTGRPNALPRLLLASLMAVPVVAQTINDADDGTVLKQHQPDFCPPGGALVFELRQKRASGDHLVRAFLQLHRRGINCGI